MDDAGLVSGSKPLRDLLRHGDGFGDRQLAATLQDLREAFPFDERHRQILDVVDRTKVVNADDVLMRDRAGEDQFALEAPLDFACGNRIAENLGPDHFQRNGHSKFRVPGLVDDTHSTGAELANDVIPRTESLTYAE